MSLIRNERTKLLATALNNIAVAMSVTTVIAPLASVFYGISHFGTDAWWPALGIAWFLAAATLHLAAQRVLGRLVP